MTAIDTHPGEAIGALHDLEGQTTPITGAHLPVRMMLLEPDLTPAGVTIRFTSDTAPDTDVWKAVRHEPLTLGHLRRRDHAFAWTAKMILLRPFERVGTPADDVDDIGLAWFRTAQDLTFQTTLGHWRNLMLLREPQPQEAGDDDELTAEPPEAWTAFKELGTWLSFSDQETSRLLGLGDKTAYGWRREGHPPQPRLARRLYEAHAFVRQLVDALGLQDARMALTRGGSDAPLALIAANRVAEAEARFADVIFGRAAEQPSIAASRSGDEDRPTSRRATERLPGGRRRVQARRGR